MLQFSIKYILTWQTDWFINLLIDLYWMFTCLLIFYTKNFKKRLKFLVGQLEGRRQRQGTLRRQDRKLTAAVETWPFRTSGGTETRQSGDLGWLGKLGLRRAHSKLGLLWLGLHRVHSRLRWPLRLRQTHRFRRHGALWLSHWSMR